MSINKFVNEEKLTKNQLINIENEIYKNYERIFQKIRSGDLSLLKKKFITPHIIFNKMISISKLLYSNTSYKVTESMVENIEKTFDIQLRKSEDLPTIENIKKNIKINLYEISNNCNSSILRHISEERDQKCFRYPKPREYDTSNKKFMYNNKFILIISKCNEEYDDIIDYYFENLKLNSYPTRDNPKKFTELINSDENLSKFLLEQCKITEYKKSGIFFKTIFKKGKRLKNEYLSLPDNYELEDEGEFIKILRNKYYWKYGENQSFRFSWICGIFDIVLNSNVLGKKWLDVSSGWGINYITALAFGIKYTGFEFFEDLYNSYQNIQLKNINNSDYKIFNTSKIPFETINLENDYDFIFSHPLYFHPLEYEEEYIYSKNSKLNYNNVFDFSKNYMLPLLKKSWNSLKSGGKMIISIEDIRAYPISGLYLNTFKTFNNIQFNGSVMVTGRSKLIHRPIWIFTKI